MPGQELFIGNKHPGFYTDKYGTCNSCNIGEDDLPNKYSQS